MELDDFKTAWQALDARLARHDRMQLELLHGQRMDRARRNLRPLFIGMALQALLGLGLVVLGVACWKQNLHAPGLFATGIVLHAFGVLNIAFAGIVAGLSSSLDYGSPVLAIQKRLRLLLRMQVFNSNACGAPWWIMWVLVVVGFAGLSPTRAAGGTPAWIWASLALGLVGMVATWAWTARAARPPTGLYARIDDGADGIRRNLRLFDDIERFERD
jgi:hypothetical protein